MSKNIFDWEDLRKSNEKKDTLRETIIQRAYDQYLDGNPDTKDYLLNHCSSPEAQQYYEFFRFGFLIRDSFGG